MFYCKWFCCGTWSSDTDELPLYNRFPDDYCTAVVTGMSRPGGVTIHQLTYSCPVLVVYDWMLTFNDEVESYWKARKNGLSCLLYCLIRYAPLLDRIFVILQMVGWTKAPQHNVSSSNAHCLQIVSRDVIRLGIARRFVSYTSGA